MYSTDYAEMDVEETSIASLSTSVALTVRSQVESLPTAVISGLSEASHLGRVLLYLKRCLCKIITCINNTTRALKCKPSAENTSYSGD